MKRFFILIIGIFLFMSFVSAGFCERLKFSDAWCQPATSSDRCALGAQWAETLEEIPACRLITCYNPASGFCSPSTPTKLCEESGGEAALEGDQRCQMGCCTSLGRNMDWMSNSQCIIESESIGATPTLDPTLGEDQCNFGSQEQGACVDMSGAFGSNCIRTTEESCAGTFHVGDLCSKYESETGCKAQQRVNCAIEEKTYHIYWYDSCNQRENVYLGDSPSAKRASNNSGRIMTSEELSEAECSSSSDCGKCDYSGGESMCASTESSGGLAPQGKIRAGNFYCKPIDCKNAQLNLGTGDKTDGESWCLFDGFIGKGKDTVGSEHYLVQCNQGEVELVEQSLMRDNLCQESKPDLDGKTEATMILNDYKSCQLLNDLTIYTEEERIQKCSENPLCVRIENLCTPAYPPGSFFWDEAFDQGIVPTDQVQSTQDSQPNPLSLKQAYSDYICGGIYLYRWDENTGQKIYLGADKGGDGTDLWLQAKRNFCMSLGDCAPTYINYLGKSGAEYYPGYTAEYWENFYKNYVPIRGEEVLYSSWGPYPENDEIGGFGTVNFMRKVLGQRVLQQGETSPGYGVLVGSGTDNYNFRCDLWSAPEGGEDCSKCNGDLLKPCNEYRCRSLGKSCVLETFDTDLNGETVEPEIKICRDRSEECSLVELNAESFNVPEGYSADRITDKETRISEDALGNSYVMEGKPIEKISFETNEYARCYYSESPFNSAPEEEFGEEVIQIYSTSENPKKFTIPIVNIPYVDDSDKIPEGDTYYLYLKCENVCGHSNVDPYKISFRVKETPDTLPPEITTETPETYLPYKTNQKDLKVLGNEFLEECKYSFSPNVPFDQMSETFSYCEPFDVDVLQYYCETTITGLGGLEDQNVYVKCKDHYNNKNEIDLSHTFIKSPSKFEISSFAPADGTIIKNNDHSPIELNVNTFGGSETGISNCRYELLGTGLGDNFPDNPGTSHSVSLTANLATRDYTIQFSCSDRAGNSAINKTKITIERDRTAPLVTRVSREGSTIEFTTNEESICYYDNSTLPSCRFFADENYVTKIDSTNVVEHSLGAESAKTYYIKCKDPYGNVNPQCAVIVSSAEID